jgi:hypothetical protein
MRKNRLQTKQAKSVTGSKVLLAVCLIFSALVAFKSGSASEIKMNLRDAILQQQCDWAMYLDVQDIQHFLNYEKSTLHPLSRVRVSYRSFPRSGTPAERQSDSKTYEEFWYYHRNPLGAKRYLEPNIRDSSLGVIVLGPAGTRADHCAALTNALLRLMIDLQFRQACTSIVLVNEENYDQIVSNLNYYHFSPGLKLGSGKQMTIHICSRSSAKEEYLYLSK